MLEKRTAKQKLLTFNNPKTMKGEKSGYLTGILHLAPSNLSGHNVCPKASNGCIKACLNTSGHGRYQRTQNARIKKTQFYYLNREEFNSQLQKEIDAAKRKAKKLDLTLAIRLNGTSDLPALARTFAKSNPDTIFYDYTKLPKPYTRELQNYHITFSRSEDNEKDCIDALAHGSNVAVVFDTPKDKELPATWNGYKVINGDLSDLRFLDEKGVVVGLYAKGKAKYDKSGFVVKTSCKKPESVIE